MRASRYTDSKHKRKNMKMDKTNILADMLDSIREKLGLSTIAEAKRYFKIELHEHSCDFSISFALRESKRTGTPIDQMAGDIKQKLSSLPFLAKAEVVNGYVNCSYNYSYVVDRLCNAATDVYGRGEETNERIMIEHTSVNPNKALHLGHIRNSVIGDSLSKLLKFSGKNVTVTNYIDDTGAQVADNVVGVKFLGMPYGKDGVRIDKYLGDEVYVKVNSMYEKDPSLLEKRAEVLKAIEKGNNEIADFTQEMVNRVLESQLKTLGRFGIFYNLINYESHILTYKFWETAFNQMKSINAIKLETEGKKKGCWVFPINGQNPEEDKIIVRSDGTVVYAGKDIAYAMWKHGLLDSDFRYVKLYEQKNGEVLWATTLDERADTSHPKFNAVDTSINIVDVRQTYEQEVVKAAVEKLGKSKDIKYIHYDYEVVALSPNTAKKLGLEVKEDKEMFQMSGRKGVYINAEDFLNSLKDKIYEETKSREAITSEEEQKKVAEALAISTLRYELIKTDPRKMLVFDVDEALKLEGKNAIYINYTYARLISILRKAGENKILKPNTDNLNLNGYEQDLVGKLLMFPDAIETASASLDLSYLANYLSSTAISINSFYNSVNVLNAEGEMFQFRLWLLDSVGKIIRSSMSILGIIPIEKM